MDAINPRFVQVAIAVSYARDGKETPKNLYDLLVEGAQVRRDRDAIANLLYNSQYRNLTPEQRDHVMDLVPEYD